MRSDRIKKGFERAPHRALLRAAGVQAEDFSKPFIAVVNSYVDIVPGHVHLQEFGRRVKDAVRLAGGVPFEFNTIGISAAEADLIRKSREEEGRGSAAEDGSRVKWSKLFTHREVLCLLLAKFLTDPVWFFYVFWLPKYLYDSRGFDIKQIGYYAWIPYAAAGFGSLFGGWFSSLLLKRGFSLNWARKTALGLSATLMPLAAFVVPSPTGLATIAGTRSTLRGSGPSWAGVRATRSRKASTAPCAGISMGAKKQEEVPEYIATFDIAVQPDVTEYACPMKIIEYMAMKKCIIAVDRKNIRELLQNQENALLFKPYDKESLKNAIYEASSNKEKRKILGEAAYSEIYKKGLFWKENVERVINIKKNLAKVR